MGYRTRRSQMGSQLLMCRGWNPSTINDRDSPICRPRMKKKKRRETKTNIVTLKVYTSVKNVQIEIRIACIRNIMG